MRRQDGEGEYCNYGYRVLKYFVLGPTSNSQQFGAAVAERRAERRRRHIAGARGLGLGTKYVSTQYSPLQLLSLSTSVRSTRRCHICLTTLFGIRTVVS